MKLKKKREIAVIVSLIVIGLLLFNHYKPFALGLIDGTNSEIFSQSTEKVVFKFSIYGSQQWVPPRNVDTGTCALSGPIAGGGDFSQGFVYASCDDNTCGSGITSYKIPQEILDKDLTVVSGSVGGLTINPLSGICRIDTSIGKRPSTPDLYAFLNCNMEGTILDCPQEEGQPTKGSVSPEGYFMVEYTSLACLDGEEFCEGTSYILCENNQKVNKGEVDGKCGYTPIICVEGIESCNGNMSQICQNGTKVDVGLIPGKCGVPTECIPVQTKSCVKTLSVTSCVGVQTCNINGFWEDCVVPDNCGKKDNLYLYLIAGGLIVGIFLILILKRKHGRR